MPFLNIHALLRTHFLSSQSSLVGIIFVSSPSFIYRRIVPDSKVHGANMGPTRGRQDPGGPRVGPMNLATCGVFHNEYTYMNENIKSRLYFK